jgi:hypothetical protein
MKLNIYDRKKVVKTYTADSYDLMFGTVEDVANAIKLDEIQNGSETEILKAIIAMAMTSKEVVKDLLKDIFEGITDDEIRHTRVRDQAAVLYEVVVFTFKGLSDKEKN